MRSFLAITLLTLTACATDSLQSVGDLDRGDVENLPAGDAIGSAASGPWQISIRTTACTSACTATQCTVGETTTAQFQVIQANGELTMDAHTRMRGGIDRDGAFLVGGYAMQGANELIGRFEGTLVGGSMVGDALVRSNACTATGDVAGTKL